MKKNLVLSLTVGFLLSAGGIYLAFRNVPFVDLFTYFGSINYWWLGPSLLLIMISFLLRALRWKIIVGSTRKIGFGASFHPLMIAFMINCVLPGRIGELARPAILKKNQNLPFSTGLATVAAERAFDISFLILLFLIVASMVQIDPDIQMSFGKYELNRSTLETITGGLIRLSLAMIAGVLLVSVRIMRDAMARLILTIPSIFFLAGTGFQNKVTKSFSKPLIRLMENFASGFDLIKSPLTLLTCLGLSVLIWGLAALSYWVFSLGCPGISLSLPEMTAVMVIVCMFIALPSVPGYWGLWEAGGMFAMILFGVPSREAAGFTLANHAMQIFPVVIVGMVSAILTGVNIWRTSFAVDSV